jgi:hypothetical protein
MITIASAVKQELEQRPLVRMLLGSELVNTRALAKDIRPAVESALGSKVGLETIAITLHREASKLSQSSLEPLLVNPDIRLLTTYHELIALNYPKGYTGAETIPDTVRYFAQTTGSNEHTIIISDENIELLDTSMAQGKIDDLSAICLGLPGRSAEIESLYASIFLFFGLQGISIVEVVSTFNELTLIIQQKDYARAYEIVSKINA